VCKTIKARHARGKSFSIIVAAEGAKLKSSDVTKDQSLDEFGHVKLGGIGDYIAKEIEKRTGFETRVSVFGHIQRGGTPTAFDRVLGTRFGVKAVELIVSKKFGQMVALRGVDIVDVPLSDAVKELKLVNDELYDVAKVFFG
jgi:6-phosphofructokinase 1